MAIQIQSAVPVSGNGPLHPENFHPEFIPTELTARNQWVCWRYEERDGKRTKAPINARSNGRLTYAKSNAPETWASFDTALTACGIHPELAGVGFCFAPDDGMTGIDLDHVFNPGTGELTPEAAEIVERFAGTYVEISPSGTGIRIFCYGKPRRSGKNVGKLKWLEVYAHPSSRYLTLTGNRWSGANASVTDQQAALDWLHGCFMESTGQDSPPVDAKPRPADPLDLDDAELLDKARRAKNGGDFERLWSGDLSAHGGDASAADLALCNLLAFYADNDPARMDRLFRQSGLFRPKWDKSHYSDGRTYGQATIEKAIAGSRETYSGRKLGVDPARPDDPPPPVAEVDPVAAEVPDWPTSGEGITDAVADVQKVKAPRPEKKLPPQNVMARKLATESFENRLRMDPITGHWLEYQPDAGIFRPRPSGAIERAVYLEISKREGAFPASYVSSVVRLLAYEATAEVEPVIGKIPFKNGVLDLQTRELLPHSPDYGFTEAIPYPWDHDAPDPTPVIDWLREAVGGHEDQVQLLRAFLHAVVVGRPDLQRYLELVGPGGTGKGTFTRLATALVGNKLTHSTTLTQLENNRFETAALFGKKLATITDAEKWHGDVSVMKSITGQDALRYEQKHIQAGEPFTFGGMVIVSANQHMESTDYSSGIQRRRITVRFDHVVQPAQKRDLDSEFAPYLPAVMKWVLDMPAHEVTAYLRMTSAHVGSLKQVRLETLAQTNPIAAWLMEAVEFGPGLAAQVGTKQAKRMTDSNGIGKTESWDVYENQDIWLYPNFCRWCDEHGKRPIACNAFGNQLIDVARNMLGHPVVRGDKRRDGSKVVGLRIKPGDAPTAFGDEPVMNRDEPVTYQPIDGDELFKLRQYSDDKSLGARQSAISTSVEAMNRVDCGKVCAEGGESDEVHHLYHNQGLSSSQSITGSSQSITGSSPPGASGDGKTASPTARILARLHGVPAGVTDEELKRAICNGKGLSPALVDLALIQLMKDGEISRLNGRWVESRA